MDTEKKQLLNKILKGEGVLFVLVGFFLSAKPYFSNLVLLDADTDLYLGYGLTLVGFINFFIAHNFFNNEEIL